MELLFFLFIILGLPVCLLYLCFGTYNRLKGVHESVKKSLSVIRGYSNKRESVLADLASVVDKYTSHEKSAHTEVASLENLADNSGAAATAVLSNLARAYPELKADTMFLKNQEELGVLAEELRSAQEDYDTKVENFNRLRNAMPTKLYAPLLGFVEDLPYSKEVLEQADGLQLIDRAYDDAKIDELRTKSVDLLASGGAAISKQSTRLLEGAKEGARGLDNLRKEQAAAKRTETEKIEGQ